VHDENNQYLQFLNEESAKYGSTADDDDDYDGPLEEDAVIDTPLHKYEPYQMFKNALLGKLLRFLINTDFIALQSGQPELYNNLTKNLTPEEQLVVQNVVHHAVALESQQQHAEIAQQTQINHGLVSPGLAYASINQQPQSMPPQAVQQQINAAIGMQPIDIYAAQHGQAIQSLQSPVLSPGISPMNNMSMGQHPPQDLNSSNIQTPPLQSIPVTTQAQPGPPVHGVDGISHPAMPHLHSRHPSEIPIPQEMQPPQQPQMQ
jgi:hypothetical protein